MAIVSGLRSTASRYAHAAARRVQPRLPDRYLLLPTRSGWLRLNLRRDPGAVRRVLRSFEPEKYENIRRFLPDGGTFVDVGANVGDFTVWAARLAGPLGRVVAIEVEPTNARWLRENVRRHGLGDRVTVVELAASDREGETELILSSSASIHTIVPSELHSAREQFRPAGTIVVATRRLDDILADAGCAEPDVVKIDVEGAELLVLEGAGGLLSSGRPMAVLIDVHFGVDLERLHRTLTDAGFTVRLETDPDRAIDVIPAGATSIVALRGLSDSAP